MQTPTTPQQNKKVKERSTGIVVMVMLITVARIYFGSVCYERKKNFQFSHSISQSM